MTDLDTSSEFTSEEQRVEQQSASFKKELGLTDLVLTQILFIVGLPWVGVAAKQGPSQTVLWLLAALLFYIPSAFVVIYLNRMQKVMFPDRIKQLKGPLGSQGPLKAFELLTAENPEGTKRRIYRATFESGLKARVTFTVDAEGKIAGANVRPE